MRQFVDDFRSQLFSVSPFADAGRERCHKRWRRPTSLKSHRAVVAFFRRHATKVRIELSHPFTTWWRHRRVPSRSPVQTASSLTWRTAARWLSAIRCEYPSIRIALIATEIVIQEKKPTHFSVFFFIWDFMDNKFLQHKIMAFEVIFYVVKTCDENVCLETKIKFSSKTKVSHLTF